MKNKKWTKWLGIGLGAVALAVVGWAVLRKGISAGAAALQFSDYSGNINRIAETYWYGLTLNLRITNIGTSPVHTSMTLWLRVSYGVLQEGYDERSLYDEEGHPATINIDLAPGEGAVYGIDLSNMTFIWRDFYYTFWLQDAEGHKSPVLFEYSPE